jgi:hypothetical protein
MAGQTTVLQVLILVVVAVAVLRKLETRQVLVMEVMALPTLFPAHR